MDVRKILDYIDTNGADYILLWRDVCNIESKSGDKAALDRVADTVEKYASSLGFAVTRKLFEKTGDFLMIDMNFAAPEGYAFLAHMDTVHDKGKFGYPPVKISGDIMTGPGVIDCKGGIAVAIQSELGIPVKYVGVGEKIDDLQKFNSNDFVNALFQTESKHKGED